MRIEQKNAKNLPQIFLYYKGINFETEETSFEIFFIEKTESV